MAWLLVRSWGWKRRNGPETVMVDYGGANVAKPLHVGHLRAAVIGESIKAHWAGSWAIRRSATCIWATGACRWG